MYLPSLGMMVFLAVFIEKICLSVKERLPKHDSLVRILKTGFVVVCIGMTVSLNFAWKNGFVMASHLMKDFPDNPRGYLFAGVQYYQAQKYDEAKLYFMQAEELGLEDPRLFHFLAICLLEDAPYSKYYFEKNVNMFPTYALSYIGLGRAYFMEEEYEKAEQYLTASLKIRPSYPAYGYLIQIYLIREDVDRAKQILAEAKKVITDEEYLRGLDNLVVLYKKYTFPVDIGV